MSGASGPASRLRPVLLSALGFPGLGQLTQRRYVAAALAGATSLALVLLLLARVYVETSARIPGDPDEVALTLLENPTWPLQLAREIERDNAAFFAWLTGGIVVVWVLSIADAWRAGRAGAAVGRGKHPR